MSSSDRHDSADERFQRMLLDSARSDELPSNVDAAWQKFGAALNGVSVLAAGASGALALRRAQRWLATKWLIWGVLTGSTLTALSLRRSQDRVALPSPAPSAAKASPSASIDAASARSAVATPQAAAAPTAISPPRSARPHARAARGEAPSAPSPSSTLSAQVALLDAARSAVAAGAVAEALRLADKYRADFPNGELAPEAEVVAIEALVAQGQKPAAAERAARFLARYPGDPHAARVKWLIR